MSDAALTRPLHRRVTLWGVPGIAVLTLAILAGVIIGETPLPIPTVAAALANNLWDAGYVIDPIDAGIIWSYRLPRTLVAAACGAGLALSGVVLQSLVRNALADPYLLGVSAGAGAGAVTVTVLGVGGGLLGISTGSFIGAALAFGVVSLLARAARGWPRTTGSGRDSRVAIVQCGHVFSDRQVGKCRTGARDHVLAAREPVRCALAGCVTRGAYSGFRFFRLPLVRPSHGCVFLWCDLGGRVGHTGAPGANRPDRSCDTDDRPPW